MLPVQQINKWRRHGPLFKRFACQIFLHKWSVGKLVSKLKHTLFTLCDKVCIEPWLNNHRIRPFFAWLIFTCGDAIPQNVAENFGITADVSTLLKCFHLLPNLVFLLRAKRNTGFFQLNY